MRALLLLALAPLAACTSGKQSSSPPDDTADSDHTGHTDDTTTDSAPPGCGDGDTDEGEQCDDGNDIDGDGCNTDCVVSGSTRWEQVLDLQAGPDCANAVAVDAAGVVAFAGETSADGQDHDVFAGLFEADGALRWSTSADSAAEGESYGGRTDRAWGVGLEADGEVYVGGHQLETVEHVWLGKVAADGAAAWARNGADTADGRAYGLALGSGGALFLVGTHGATSFVGRYDTDGVTAWTQEFSGTDGCDGCDLLWAAAAMDDGGVTAVGAVGNTTRDALVVRLDAEGGTLWQDVIDAGGDDHAYAVTRLAEGVLVGVLDGFGDTTLRFYDDSGMMQWSLPGPGVPDGGYSTALAAAPDGGFYTLAVGWRDGGATRIERIGRFDVDGGERWTRDVESDSSGGWARLNGLATVGGDLVVGGCRSEGYGIPEDTWVLTLAP